MSIKIRCALAAVVAFALLGCAGDGAVRDPSYGQSGRKYEGRQHEIPFLQRFFNRKESDTEALELATDPEYQEYLEWKRWREFKAYQEWKKQREEAPQDG